MERADGALHTWVLPSLSRWFFQNPPAAVVKEVLTPTVLQAGVSMRRARVRHPETRDTQRCPRITEGSRRGC